MPVKIYTHLFFDLDHTLWDFEANSTATLNEIFVLHQLKTRIASPEIFISTYQAINKNLWALYHQRKIDKETLRLKRFALTLEQLNVYDPVLSHKIADDYIHLSPTKGKLFPGTHEVLTSLKKKYQLSLITNGFKEVQNIKLSTSGLNNYFSNIFISEDVGYQKPEPELFLHALKVSGAKPENSLMIGDNFEADIIGASSIGMDTAYFDFNKEHINGNATYYIAEISQLLEFL